MFRRAFSLSEQLQNSANNESQNKHNFPVGIHFAFMSNTWILWCRKKNFQRMNSPAFSCHKNSSSHVYWDFASLTSRHLDAVTVGAYIGSIISCIPIQRLHPLQSWVQNWIHHQMLSHVKLFSIQHVTRNDCSLGHSLLILSDSPRLPCRWEILYYYLFTRNLPLW